MQSKFALTLTHSPSDELRVLRSRSSRLEPLNGQRRCRADVPAASPGGVPLPGKTRGGTPRELAGEDARATAPDRRARHFLSLYV